MAKKKTQGWLDAYDDEMQLGGYVYPVNYVPQAENGIEGTMGGLTDQGFDYNGAWGGPSMQMGGSMPGSVGFTYARTKGIPSNGPYAKKTMASAQKGISVSDNTSVKKPVVKLSPDELKVEQLKQYAQRASKKEQPVVQSRGATPDAFRKQLYQDAQNAKLKNQLLKGADVATDIMQVGNFIPHPIGQAIGEVGNMLGGWVDSYEAYDAYNKGNYGDVAMNAASVALPMVLGAKGYRRDMWNTEPGSVADRIASLGNREGRYIHLTPPNRLKNNPVIKKGVNFNRSLLGALGAETAYDSYQNGGEMKFYQEGLDWTPKNISKDGSEIPKAQPGKKITFEDLVKSTKKRATSDNTNSGIKSKVANKVAAKNISNQKAEQKVQTLVDKGGYSEAHARRAVKNKEEKANSILEKVSNDDYRIQMHPDFDPNKSTDEQSYLLNDNSLRTRLLRGSNMLMNAGNPVGDFAAGMITAPARSFANLTMDANNRYFNPNNTGAGNSANFAEDVINIFPSIIPGAAGALGQAESLIGQGFKSFAKTSKPASVNPPVENIFSKLPIPEWILEEMRFQSLPELNNPNATKVLENFRKRIQTPEGQKRLKDLGITDTKVLDNLTIVGDENTLGHYWMNKIGLHPELPEIKRVTRHEIEHAVQNAVENSRMNKYNQDANNLKYLFRPKAKKKAIEAAMKPTSEIDDMLGDLELRKTPEKVDWVQRKKTRGKLDPSQLFSYMLDKQNATNYFDSGSMGKEKSAFLSEVQQYMMDEGIIPKTSYSEITPEMVKETFINAMFDEKGGKYLRLFNIMKPSESNYKLVSNALNKMLTVAPIVGGATAVASQPEQKKKGGKIKKDDMGYWNPDNWGKPVEIGSNEITMEGVYEPLLGISDTGDTQMMYPGEDYKFKGKKVTEYPVAQNGKLQPLVDEQLEYIQSPLYKQRLTNMNVKDADQIAKLRADYLKKLKIEVKDRSPIGGVSNQTTSVYENGVERPVVTLMRGDYDEGIAAHEIGHVTTAPYSGTKVTSPYNASYNQLSPAESWMFYNRNKTLKPQLDYVYNQYTQTHVPESMIRYYDSDIVGSRLSAKDSSQVGYKPDIHDVSATEAYGDLSAIRHFLKKSGVTKSYGERLTPDMWKKAMENKKLSNEEHFKRMRKNYNDDAIIQLNNIIAQNKSSIGEDTAKNGGWLEKYK